MKKIVFLTATRADYGKMKSILKQFQRHGGFELHVFVTGMHMLEQFGSTYNEVLRDGYSNVFLDINYQYRQKMDLNVAGVIVNFSRFVSWVKPDMIVVHGDRQDAIAGAVVGAFNNILVAHIEGGEVSGTIDESIRHAITKFSHVHFVANEEAKKRLIQLGEREDSIFCIGSPDIDIMLNASLPSLDETRIRYSIPFKKYAILIYHPVVTEIDRIGSHINTLLGALQKSRRNYVVISPNNDHGNEIISSAYRALGNKKNFRVLPSMRFEHFLTLLKHASFIIGNSSAGIREACVYGVPAIDIGSRQQGRYDVNVLRNIIHVEHEQDAILSAINKTPQHAAASLQFGGGGSAEAFYSIISEPSVWEIDRQKRFVDLNDF